MTLRYFLYLPAHIATILLRYPLAPIAVALSSSETQKLRFPFRWLDAIDNNLLGDGGHQERQIAAGRSPEDFLSKCVWIWRNGGNWMNYYPLGMPRDTDWFWSVDTTPGWQWRMGWNPEDFKQDRSKYNFTVRYRKG